MHSKKHPRRLNLLTLEDRVTPNATYHNLGASNFSQNWANNALINANDDWAGVPSIIGYLGQDTSTTASGTDPQTILGVSSTVPDEDVIANQTSTSLTNGGVAEFEITNPVVALQGSGTADWPYLLIHLNTTGRNTINISYNLRDIDGTADNAVQQVALQYRVGSSGNFTNLPAGYVADASTGPSLATLVTPVSVTLPMAAENQAQVQVRIITTNASGTDEWIGVDDISVTSNGVAVDNGPPINTRPASVTATEDVAFNFTTPNTISVTDPDSNLATTQLTVTNGTLNVSLAGGATITGGANGSATLTLAGTQTQINNALATLTYTSTLNYNGSATLTIVSTDSGTPALNDTDTTTITVNAANDAPVLSGANPFIAISEDAVTNTGTLVSDLISGQVTDIDAGALAGIAITGTDTTNGTWEYTINGGTNWTAVGLVSTISGRLLASNANTRVRFVPNANFNGTVSTAITFRAWDQTSGTNGGTGNPSINGGTTAFSTTTASSSITVNAVNDGPSNTVPGTQGVVTNGTITFNGAKLLSIADIDAGSNAVQVTLTVTAGTLTLNGTAGLSFTTGTGTGNATMTFTGTITAINTALNGMVFNAPGTAGNVTLTLTTNDQGNTGGGALTDSDTVTLNVFAPMYINEIHFNPPNTDIPNEYVELRGTPNATIPSGTYLLGIEGDSGGTTGQVQTIFNLSGLTFGSNGYLVFVQAGNSYTVNGSATTISGTTTGFGGMPGSIFSDQNSGGTEIENVSVSFLMVQAPTAPTLGLDIDSDDNGVGDGTAYNAWTVLDGVGFVDATIDVAYAPIVFATVSSAVAPGSLIVNYGSVAPAYAGRSGDTTGSTAADWVGGTTTGSAPNFSMGAGNTAPVAFENEALDHIGSTNFPPPANTAPTNTVPGPQSTNEDTALVFSSGNSNLISISDADAGTNAVQVQLTAVNGTITLNGIAGLSFTVGTGTANPTMTFTGTITAINTALAGMSFNPTANYNGPASVQIITDDLGNSGSGGALSDTDTVSITVVSVNDAPAGANKTITLNEDASYTFTAGDFGFTDPNDLPANTLAAVTITTLPTTGELRLNGNLFTAGTSIPVANIGLLVFTPVANAFGAPYSTFTFQVQDNGTGANLDLSANTITFNVDPLNDMPTVQNLNAAETYTEDTPLNLIDIIISDPEDTNGSITLTLSNPAAGSLNTGTSGAVTSTYNSGTGVWAATGAIADINVLLAGLTFTPAPNSFVNFTMQVQVADAAMALVMGSKSFTGIPVNDPPAGTDKTITINEDAPYALTVADFGLTDPNDLPPDALAAVIITTLPTAGTLTNNGNPFVAGTSIPVANITGGLLVFTPVANAFGSPYGTFTFQVQDAGTGTNLDLSANTITFNVTPVNDAPTAVALQNTTTSLPENTSTASAIKLADIVVTDDGMGTNTLSLSGADMASFEIVGTDLFLIAGVSLNFEVKSSYSVTVNVDDTAIPGSPDASTNYTLTITDVNEAPTVSLANTVTSLPENTSTASAIKVADIVVTDDALGSEMLSLSGADMASFEIVGTDLFLIAGVSLNFEVKSSYSVTVNVDDAAIPGSPDSSVNYTLTVTDVNEAPTVSLANVVASLAENTATPVKVADIVVTDDALGSETLSLSGTDMASFEIVGNELLVRSTVSLDFEVKSSYSVTVNVDDAAIPGSPDSSVNYTLTVTNVNEAPTAISLTNVVASLSENTSTASAVQVALIVVTDDAMGMNGLFVGGADQAFFEVVGNALRLKAGTDLDAVAKPSYTISVHVDDTAVGTNPDVSTTYTLAVLPNNVPTLTRISATLSGAEGSTLSNSGTYSDGDSDPLSLTASVGTVVNNNNGTWSWSYVVPDNTASPITVTISGNDGFGGIGQTTFTYTATNLPPTTTGISGPTGRQPGASGTYSLANVGDPGSGDVSTLRYSLALTVGGLASNYSGALGTNSATFNFPTEGTYVVYGRVYDKDGGISSTQQITVTVANQPPTATVTTTFPAIVSPATMPVILRGSTHTFTVSNVIDVAGTNATFTVRWDWDGDGVTDAEDFTVGGQAYGSPALLRSFNFPTAGIQTVRVRVTDDASGLSSLYSFPVDVRVVAIDPTGVLTVAGTNGANTFMIDPGTTAGSVRMFVDGVFYGTFGPTSSPPLTGIRIMGQNAVDTLTLIGTSGHDIFDVRPDVIADAVRDKEFRMNGLPISTLNVESYSLKGGEGNDTFNIAGAGNSTTTRDVSLQGDNGDDTVVSQLTATDNAGGLTAGTDWLIEGPQRGTLEGFVKFNTMQHLTGNSEADSFRYNNGGSMPGLVTAGDGNDTLNLTPVLSAATIFVQPTGSLNTPVGTHTGINLIVGTPSTADRIVGANEETLWTITGPNLGNYILDDQPAVSFQAIENLTGGTANDTFDFLMAGSLTGSIAGGTGNDTLTYASRTTATNVTIAPPTAPSMAGWSAIERVVGGSGNNTLTASNVSNTWTLTGANTGTLNALSFENFATLTGGTATDAFKLGATGSASSINGGAGTNTLDYTGASSGVLVGMGSTSSGSATRLTTFTNLSSLVGGSGSDTLSGTTSGDTIVVTAANAGTVNSTTYFSAFENLVGGGGADTFRLQSTLAAPVASINGGGGMDTLIGANRDNLFDITGTNSGVLNSAMFFSNFENLTGGSAKDDMRINGGSVQGALNGGSGNDTLNVGTGGTVNLASNTANGVGTTITSFEIFAAVNGSITGPNTTNTWRLTASNTGTLNSTITFNGFANVTGGTGQDRVLVSTGGVSGTLNGGDGSDILDYSSVVMARPYNTFVGTFASGQFRTGLAGNPLMTVLAFESISNNL